MTDPPEITPKEKKILSIIGDYPDGISLPETAYIMDVPFVSLIQDIKNLLKKSLLRKKNNIYFIKFLN